MKTSKLPPSLNQIKNWLSDDPLRSSDSKKHWAKASSLDFTRNLLDRIAGARYEPRIAESIVERLVLFSNKIELSLLVTEFNKSQDWMLLAIAPLVQFAEGLHKTPQKLLLLKFLEGFRLQKLRAIHGLESYYFGAATKPGPRTLRVVAEENLAIWARWGYWAGSEPYSKELLKKIPRSKASSLAPYAIYNAITTYALKSSPQKFSLGHIHKDLNLGISRRQLSRILNSHSKLKRTGILKGARYSLK